MKKTLVMILALLFAMLLLQGCDSGGSSVNQPDITDSGLVLTLEELSGYDGKDGKPAYIAVDGVIYDVTNVPQWNNGAHNGFSAGHDLTDEIKSVSPHGVSKLTGIPIVGQLEDVKIGVNIYPILGLLNIVLLAVMTAPFWLRFLNDRTLHLKGGKYGKIIKFLRTLHKPLGVVIIIIAAIHGYLALGTIRLHTGILVFLALLVTATLGGSFYRFKKKSLFTWHRRMVLVVVFFLLIHLLFPNALYYLMN